MKVNSEKAFREKNWRTIFETMEDNLLTVLDVLHEEYGFGEKRLLSFLQSVCAYSGGARSLGAPEAQKQTGVSDQGGRAAEQLADGQGMGNE